MNIANELFIFKKYQFWAETDIFLWPNFLKKGNYFHSKTDKIYATIEFCVFELVFLSNFTLNNFEFLDQICPRRIFMVKNRKSEHHHWIVHIRISFGSKFSLNWQLWRGLRKKGFYDLKQKKWTLPLNSAYSN